jgi:GT2 family glycosyltransferase
MANSSAMACDIVLTVYNQPELTQNCLYSLVKYFRPQDGLIIVDNGSLEETKRLLEEFKNSHPRLGIKLLRLQPNQGFVRAANVGLKQSTKSSVCLLSNDTVVTEGWLDRMSVIMERETDIGLVNPMSTTSEERPGH